MRRLISFWGPPIVWAAVIFALSSIPQSDVPSLINPVLEFIAKKTGHVLEYGILALLLLRALQGHRQRFVVAGVISFLYAISDEFHQSFVPHREPTLRDVIIDGAAVAFFLLLSYLWMSRRDRQTKS